MYMHMLMRWFWHTYVYLYMYGHSVMVIPSYPVYQNVTWILYEYVNHLKFPFPLTFSAKTLWVPAHCKISSENFVGARAPRTRRSAPHACKRWVWFIIFTHCNIIFFKKTLKNLYNAFLASMEPADAFELNLIWTRSPHQVLKTICRLGKQLELMVRGRVPQRQRRALNLYTHTWFVLESSDMALSEWFASGSSAFISNFGLILN